MLKLTITIGTGHVADIYSPAVSDPPDLQEARVKIVSYLNDLLSGQLDQSSSSSSSLENDIGNLGDALDDISKDQKSMVGKVPHARGNNNALNSLKELSSLHVMRTSSMFGQQKQRFNLADLLDRNRIGGLLEDPNEQSPGTSFGPFGNLLMPGEQTSTQSNAQNKIVANTQSVEPPAPTESPTPIVSPAPTAQSPAPSPPTPSIIIPPTSYTPSQYVPDTPSEVISNRQQKHSSVSFDTSHKHSSAKKSSSSVGSLRVLSTQSLDLLSVLSDDTLSKTSATSASSIPKPLAPTPVTPSESEFYNENLNANPADLTPDRDSAANATAENAAIYAILHPKKKPDSLKLDSFTDLLNFSFTKQTKGPTKHNDKKQHVIIHGKGTKKASKAGKTKSSFSIGITLNSLPSFPNYNSTLLPVIGLQEKLHKTHSNHTAPHTNHTGPHTNHTVAHESHSTTYPQFGFAKSDVFSVESSDLSKLQLPSFIASKIFQESGLVSGVVGIIKT